MATYRTVWKNEKFSLTASQYAYFEKNRESDGFAKEIHSVENRSILRSCFFAQKLEIFRQNDTKMRQAQFT